MKSAVLLFLTFNLLGCLAVSFYDGANGPYLRGVSLAGAEFGSTRTSPGWGWPNVTSMNYWIASGVNIVRLPFMWDRLQPFLGGGFQDYYIAGMNSTVSYLTSQGVYVVLDCHNYARYPWSMNSTNWVGKPGGPTLAQFYNLWNRLGSFFGGNQYVYYGLMNEPSPNSDANKNIIVNSFSAQDAWNMAQWGIWGLRNASANGLVLASGTAWTGAVSWTQTWYSTGTTDNNAAVFANNFNDAANNNALEVHVYFDLGFGGTSTDCLPMGDGSAPPNSSPTSWNTAVFLNPITQWASTYNKRLFLGEFGFMGTSNCITVANDVYNYLVSNGEWFGWTYWAGGSYWGSGAARNNPYQAGLSAEPDYYTGGTTPAYQFTNFLQKVLTPAPACQPKGLQCRGYVDTQGTAWAGPTCCATGSTCTVVTRAPGTGAWQYAKCE